MKTSRPPLKVARTEGCKIILEDGRELIDGIASWWTACHGYNHPHIRAAVEKQLAKMPHIMLGGLVHETALKLAERLAKLTGLPRVFFCDSGSVSVEVAMKMTLQFWSNQGKSEKNRFVCFENGYHGDTMGAMSVSDPEHSMHGAFKHNVTKQYVAKISDLSSFESLLKNNQDIAGVIIEPLVQGAGGMILHSPETLAEIYHITKKYGALFIADEIATGFGRTGTMFACEQAKIIPDIMCIGKALTGGTMTLAGTLASQEVFEAFLSNDPKKAFMHGPTYMANPLACAAANASLDLFFPPPLRGRVRVGGGAALSDMASGTTPPPSTFAKASADANLPPQGGEEYHPLTCVAVIEKHLREELKPCLALPNVVDVRVKGAIGVVQLKEINIPELRQKFVESGVWIRPIEDVVYLMPALNISPDNLSDLTISIYKTIS